MFLPDVDNQSVPSMHMSNSPGSAETELEQLAKDNLKTFILENELFFLPLHSIENGICTCTNPGCTSPGKHPTLKWNWKLTSSNKAEFINAWFEKTNINYGILTGRYSKKTGKYLIVIDVDAPDHPIIKDFPKTYSYQTGSGGWHFWFWSKYLIPNSVSKLAAKVDVRGNNGYVVVPPSKHISGGRYVGDTSAIEIADIPKFVISKVFGDENAKIGPTSALFAGRKVAKGSRLSKILDANVNLWAKANISQIREWLTLGNQIPEGIRNVTVHRLLCSDRAKGCSEPELKANAKYYLSCCQAGVRKYSEYEVNASVAQAAKHRTYNTSYEKVHSAFYDMVKKSKRLSFTQADLKRMEEVDAQFFNKRLSVATSKNRYISLEALSVARDEHMKNAGFTTFSRYPQHLLAGKLKSLGYERHRTAKQNVWNIEISAEINELTNAEKSATLVGVSTRSEFLPQEKGFLQMTMKVQEVNVKVKLKKHPSAGRYPGWPSQELGSASLKLVELLDPSDRIAFFKNELVLDEYATSLDFDAVRVGDRIGHASFKEGEGWTAMQLDVHRIANDTLYCSPAFGEQTPPDEELIEVAFEDVSISRALGYFEILYRPEEGWNGNMDERKLVPYGIELEQEVKLLIPQSEEEEEPAPAAPAPSPEEVAREEFLNEMAAAGIVDPLVIEAMAKVRGVSLTPAVAPDAAPSDPATIPSEETE